MFAVKFLLFLGFSVIVSVSSFPSKEVHKLRHPRQVDEDNVVSFRRKCTCECGVSSRRTKVVGGNVTQVHEFPWLVSIFKGGEFYCGATLITRSHLLTAAHCMNGINVKHVIAVLGDHDRDAKDRFAKTIVRTLKCVTAHKLFDSVSYNNDIAVLELDEPVDFDYKVQPACLPNNALVDYTGYPAVVAGWGRTGEHDKTSPVLRKVIVPVWSKKDCYESGYGEQRLSENMFCAGYKEGKRDACQGDSGGPLHVKNERGNMQVIGVVSWGRGCARPNLPGIYTKIVNYLDWLEDSLNGECLCVPPQYSPRRA